MRRPAEAKLFRGQPANARVAAVPRAIASLEAAAVREAPQVEVLHAGSQLGGVFLARAYGWCAAAAFHGQVVPGSSS